MISDSTGETLIAAGRAAASQFADSNAVEHVYPLVRNRKQVADVLAEIDRAPGIVLHTVIDQELAGVIDEACSTMGVPCVSVIEPVLQIFQSYLGAPSKRRVGAQHELNAGYFARIEALNFTMDHDDGQLPAYRFGRVIRLKETEVADFIERCRIVPGSLDAGDPDTDPASLEDAADA